MNKKDICNLFDYHVWALDHQLVTVRQLCDEQFNQEVGGSFPCIRLTLLHLVGSDHLWISRLMDKTMPTSMLAGENFPTLEKIERQLGETRAKWQIYLSELDEEKLSRPFEYRNLQGEPISMPLWQVLHHIVNHGTYHRGQLTSMLRQVGAVPQTIDALVYYRSL